MLEAKKKLAPEEYIDSCLRLKKEKVMSPYIVTDNPPTTNHLHPKAMALRYCDLLKARDNEYELPSEAYDIWDKYNLDAIIFEGER